MEDSLRLKQPNNGHNFFGGSSDKKSKFSTSYNPRQTARSSQASNSPSPHINLLSNNILEAEEFMSKSARIE